jgi:hypothetical protein
MTMDDWIEEYGTPEIRRAHAEGYDVVSAVVEWIFARWASSVRLPVIKSWDSVGERKAPSAESFGHFDRCHDAARALPLPPGYSVRLGRISRITVEDEFFTGVLGYCRADTGHEYARAFDFEA